MSKYTYTTQQFTKTEALILLNSVDNKETSKENKILNKAFTIIFKNSKSLNDDTVNSIAKLFQNCSNATFSSKGKFVLNYTISDETRESIINLAVSILNKKKENQIKKINKELNFLR